MALHSESVLLTFVAMANADKVKRRWEVRVTDLERKRRGNTRGNIQSFEEKRCGWGL